MFLVNYISYKYFINNIYNGDKLHTKFGHYEEKNDNAIKYK